MKSIKCRFCDALCCKGNAKGWQICHSCDVSFCIRKKKIDLIHFKVQGNHDVFYTVMLSLLDNNSSIYSFKKIYGAHHASLVASFDHIIDFTPNNIKDKLKTYLMFL